MIDALVETFAYAEHHGRGSAHSQLMRGAVHAHPVVGIAFEARYAVPDLVVENLRAAAGDGVEAGVAQPRDGRAQVEIRVLGDGQHLRGREAVQPDLGKPLLDAAKQPFGFSRCRL